MSTRAVAAAEILGIKTFRNMLIARINKTQEDISENVGTNFLVFSVIKILEYTFFSKKFIGKLIINANIKPIKKGWITAKNTSKPFFTFSIYQNVKNTNIEIRMTFNNCEFFSSNFFITFYTPY